VATLNYTTTIAAGKTVAEIQELLGAHGADRVMVGYTAKRPSSVSFSLVTPAGPRAFTLPVEVTAMHRVLQHQAGRREIDRRYSTAEQAERTAWRVVKDWLAAQLTLVSAEMASLETVMLPYLVVDHTGTTLHQRYLERGLPALEASQ
jgi:hypothetical protein